MKVLWEKRNKQNNLEGTDEFVEKLKISPTSAKLLKSRGITDIDEAKRFLWPNYSDLHPTDLLPDIQPFLERLQAAIDNQEIITIYGDYDADGTVATAILLRYLRSIGANVNFYIPNRLKEGYGLNKEAIDLIAQRGTDLIITVDNGISALEEAEYIREKGMDLLITDHHEPGKTLPVATAVVDCKREDSQYPFSELCGAGLAFKLVLALDEIYHSGLDIETYLQMATISTIADLVPLKDENRTIAKLGLNSVNQSGFKNPGLNALKNKADLDKVEAYHVGFRIGPMINAPGRLGQVGEVMALLISDDPEVIEEKAELLHENNIHRTQIEKAILKQALELVEKKKLYEDDIIIVPGRNWHSGVIGIVASKIQESWNKPVIVISFDEEGNGKGSCRSIPGFNIFEALQSADSVLDHYGGHEQAAGLSIGLENLKPFRETLREYTKTIDMEPLFKKRLAYDAVIKTDDINKDLVSELQFFEPTGIGNPGPLFNIAISNISNLKAIGKEKEHLSFNADTIRAIAFGKAADYPKRIIAPAMVLAKPEINCYNNAQSLQLKVKDIKENPFISFKAANELLENCDTAQEITEQLENFGSPVKINRKLLVYLYNLIKKHSVFSIDHFLSNTGESVLTLAACLKILEEASLISYKYDNNQITASILPADSKKDLTQTNTYLKFQN